MPQQNAARPESRRIVFLAGEFLERACLPLFFARVASFVNSIFASLQFPAISSADASTNTAFVSSSPTNRFRNWYIIAENRRSPLLQPG